MSENHIELEHLKHALESRRQLRQAAMNFEHVALRPLYLLNGGGLVAFLTFLGTGSTPDIDKGWVTGSLVAWLIGLVLAGFTTIFAYRSQFHFYKAHGDYQRVKVGLKEYPVDDEISDEDLLKRGKCSSALARKSKKAAVRSRMSLVGG